MFFCAISPASGRHACMNGHLPGKEIRKKHTCPDPEGRPVRTGVRAKEWLTPFFYDEMPPHGGEKGEAK